MAAHRRNVKEAGLFTSKSVQQMEKLAEKLLDKSVYCFDLSEVPDTNKQDAGYESAIKLKEILDRIKLPLYEDNPDEQAIANEEKEKKAPEKDNPDGQAVETKKVPELKNWRLPNTNIVISEVLKGPRKGEFLFTPQTVSRIDRFYDKIKYLPYKTGALISIDFLDFYESTPGSLLPPKWDRWIPAWSTAMYFNQTVWQWFALFVLPLIAWLAVWSIRRLLKRKSVNQSSIIQTWASVTVTLVAAVAAILVYYILDTHINITGSILTVCNITLFTIFWCLLAWMAFLCGIAVSKTIIASPKIDPDGIHASLIIAAGGFIGTAVAAVLLLYGLSSLGLSLVPLLTGLGVGGLAISLASKSTLENLIGGFMILVDRPYRIGQRIKIKGYIGDVEKIGLRSTRIRLKTGNQAIIPNGMMAQLDVENIGRRPYIRRQIDITITYDTPPEKIEKAVKIIENILDNHEGMDPKFPPRVFFNEFNPESLNIWVNYWYHPPNYWDFTEFNQRVNLQIMREFEKEGIVFAFPTTTTYLTQEGGQALRINFDNDIKSES